jgi:hypothetical protein
MQIYNPLVDHNNFKKTINIRPDKRTDYFEGLRRNYPVRREFFNYLLKIHDFSADIVPVGKVVQSLGFQII